MATELLRRLGHARGRALSAVSDTAFCLHATRDFTGGAGRCCLSETKPQRWRGPSLHAGVGYLNSPNTAATVLQVFLLFEPYCSGRIDLMMDYSQLASFAADSKVFPVAGAATQPPHIALSMH